MGKDKNPQERGCCKRCCINCLAMCCLFPMAWVAFLIFDLSSAITGGLFQNIGPALQTALTMAVPQGGQIISFLANGLLGLLLIIFFPLHWLLQYRPDEPIFAIAVMIPWILTAFISALIWARDMKEGFMFGIKIALSWLVLAGGIYILLDSQISKDPMAAAVVEGISEGLTDLSPLAAIASATIEGGIIGGIFGALGGAIRYDPNKVYLPKGAKTEAPAFSQTGYTSQYEPTPGAASYTTTPPTGGSPSAQGVVYCINCGKQLEPGEMFCTNCGTKRPDV